MIVSPSSQSSCKGVRYPDPISPWELKYDVEIEVLRL